MYNEYDVLLKDIYERPGFIDADIDVIF